MSTGYRIVGLNQSSTRAVARASKVVRAIYNPRTHTETQLQARDAVIDLPRVVVGELVPLFASLGFRDFLIQTKPYLRIARPNEPGDNVGFHRDTWYGSHPSELAIWIPLVDCDDLSALRVRPGSHLEPEGAYPWESIEPQCEKGSEKHSLGFLYAPKRLKTPVQMEAVPVRVGQVIIFSAALLHGQEVNRGEMRFSMDCRIAHQGVGNPRPDYYTPWVKGS